MEQPVVPSVFDEMEDQRPPDYASTGQRFANYIVDIIVFYILIMVVAGGISIVLLVSGLDLLAWNAENPVLYQLYSYILSFVLMFFAYFIIEGASKGRTIGKLITGTRAVKTDGSAITWKDAATRSISRLIPFEPFSAFGGNPWHDRLSKTMVVRTR